MGCVVLTILAAQWSESRPWLLHHARAADDSGKVPTTVTQKFGAENVDQSPDHSSLTPGYCCRSRRCSCSVRALSHSTPSSTTPGRLELSWGIHQLASSAVTKGRSEFAICCSCCRAVSGSAVFAAMLGDEGLCGAAGSTILQGRCQGSLRRRRGETPRGAIDTMRPRPRLPLTQPTAPHLGHGPAISAPPPQTTPDPCRLGRAQARTQDRN
jgi:hypothetical protein